MKWVNIFRTGTHTDSAGRTRTWSGRDLDAIAQKYSDRTEDAPVVFGHPKDNEPAQGWVCAVRKAGDFLQAQFAGLTDKAKEGIDNGSYKYGSLSLTPNHSIRHFGLLGAVPPAVKGLGEVSYQADDEEIAVTINFSELDGGKKHPADPRPEAKMKEKELEAKLKKAEENMAKEKAAKEKAEAELKAVSEASAAREATQAKEKREAAVGKLVDTGKVLPADKEKVLAFCEALEGGEDTCFADGEGKKPLSAYFLDFLQARPSYELTTDFSAPVRTEEQTEDLTQYV